MSNWGLLPPMTPAISGPEAIPILWHFCHATSSRSGCYLSPNWYPFSSLKIVRVCIIFLAVRMAASAWRTSWGWVSSAPATHIMHSRIVFTVSSLCGWHWDSNNLNIWLKTSTSSSAENLCLLQPVGIAKLQRQVQRTVTSDSSKHHCCKVLVDEFAFSSHLNVRNDHLVDKSLR